METTDETQKFWLHRISYENSVTYPLLNKGYLSAAFAWPALQNKEFVKKTAVKDKKYFEKTIGNIGRGRWTLWRFIAEMKKGDVVLVPNSWGAFSLYKIENDEILLPWELPWDTDLADVKSWNGSEIRYDEAKHLLLTEKDGKVYDVGFFRKVKELCKDIPRKSYADSALTSRMKIRDTNANISDLTKSIHLAYDNFGAKRKISLKENLLEKTIDIWLKTIRAALNPDKFEKLVGLYFNQIGGMFEIPAKNKRDKAGDVDVIATFENVKTIINVQVKFHSGNEGSFAVKQISDYAEFMETKQEQWLNDGYTRQYWVISTADEFSEKAVELASENRVTLISGKAFVEMLMNAGIQNLDDGL